MSQKLLQEVKSTGLWVTILDYGALGLTSFSLVMLFIQLVLVGELYRRGHSILIVGGLVGFVVHAITSRILISARNAKAGRAVGYGTE